MALHRQSPLQWMILCSMLHLGALLIFMKGFLLTRVEFPDASPKQHTDDLRELKTYNKLVLLIVDAVRYDFICEAPTAEKPFAGAFPKTFAKVEAGVGQRRISRALKQQAHCHGHRTAADHFVWYLKSDTAFHGGRQLVLYGACRVQR
jgi:hypothetical protein